MNFVVVAIFLVLNVFAERKDAVVRTDQTSYVGEVVRFGNDSGVSRFLGIRYGEAPSGDLRFRAPKPHVPTECLVRSTTKNSIRKVGHLIPKTASV